MIINMPPMSWLLSRRALKPLLEMCGISDEYEADETDEMFVRGIDLTKIDKEQIQVSSYKKSTVYYVEIPNSGIKIEIECPTNTPDGIANEQEKHVQD